MPSHVVTEDVSPAPSTLDSILTFEELSRHVPYTRQHLGRLEKKGEFPRRVQLGGRRVGWSCREVSRWIEAKKASRCAAEGVGPRE